MSIKVQPPEVTIGPTLIKLALKQTKIKKSKKMMKKIKIETKSTSGWSSMIHKSTIGISLLNSEADALVIKELKLLILKELQLICCSTNV